MPSVYKDSKSKYWQTDIWVDGRKFSRSTRRTTEREARAEANRLEKELREQVRTEDAAGDSLMLDHVAGRYMKHVGDHHAGKDNTRRLVALLVERFGATKLITDITHQDVLELREWRRAHTVGKRKPRPISAYVVNDTIEQLKKLFTYLRPSLAQANPDRKPFPREPVWKDLWLDEPRHTPRELLGGEEERLVKAVLEVRPDLWPLIQFARACGKRKTNCYTLTWDQVNWEAGVIGMMGKGVAGGKPITVKITPSIRAILWPLQGHHPTRVFTMVAQRTQHRVVKGKQYDFARGERYPWERDGLRNAWDQVRAEAGLTGDNRFRWHDLRVDFGSKLLRSVKTAQGMKMVQAALDHEDIKTTMDFYASVQEEEHFDAIEALAKERAAREMQYSLQKPPEFPPEHDRKKVSND